MPAPEDSCASRTAGADAETGAEADPDPSTAGVVATALADGVTTFAAGAAIAGVDAFAGAAIDLVAAALAGREIGAIGRYGS